MLFFFNFYFFCSCENDCIYPEMHPILKACQIGNFLDWLWNKWCTFTKMLQLPQAPDEQIIRNGHYHQCVVKIYVSVCLHVCLFITRPRQQRSKVASSGGMLLSNRASELLLNVIHRDQLQWTFQMGQMLLN